MLQFSWCLRKVKTPVIHIITFCRLFSVDVEKAPYEIVEAEIQKVIFDISNPLDVSEFQKRERALERTLERALERALERDSSRER